MFAKDKQGFVSFVAWFSISRLFCMLCRDVLRSSSHLSGLSQQGLSQISGTRVDSNQGQCCSVRGGFLIRTVSSPSHSSPFFSEALHVAGTYRVSRVELGLVYSSRNGNSSVYVTSTVKTTAQLSGRRHITAGRQGTVDNVCIASSAMTTLNLIQDKRGYVP